MDTLPTEVVGHIIGFLDLRCQLRLSAVSVWWQGAVSDCLRRRRRLELDYPTDAELRTLLPRMPALRVLRVGLGSLTDIVFDTDIVSENCPHLEKLDLSPFRLDADSLERLCRRCPRLCDVRLPENCRSDLLELLLRQLPGMRALRLDDMDVSAAAIALMPAGLERLKMFWCRVHPCKRQPSDRDLADGLVTLLSGCPKLRALHVYPTSTECDVDFVSQNCPHLEELDLISFQLDTGSLERLCRRCPRLCDVRLPQGCSSDLLELMLLRLPGMRTLKLHDTAVSAAAVALLPATLERLTLTDCRLDLLPSSHLQHLEIFRCTRITEDGLASGLGRLRQLRTLDLLNMPCVTDRVLDSLAGAQWLTELKLGVVYGQLEIQFTMEALQRLIETCPSLSSVELALRENWTRARQLESLIAGLSDRLDRGRDVTLAIPSLTLQKLPKSVLPSETSPLRLASLY